MKWFRMIRRQSSKRAMGLASILLCAILSASAADYRHLQWQDLQTEADRIPMQNLPPIDHGKSPEGTLDPFASLSGGIEAAIKRSAARQQATAVLKSTTGRAEL